jgi:hypothetical protein
MVAVYLKKSIPTHSGGMDFSWIKIYGYLIFLLKNCGVVKISRADNELRRFDIRCERTAFHAGGDAEKERLGERAVADRLEGLQLERLSITIVRDLIGQIASSSSQL